MHYTTFYGKRWGGDGSNIRLIYNEDEQPLVFPQIAKNKVFHAQMCPTLSYPPSLTSIASVEKPMFSVTIHRTEHLKPTRRM